MQQTLAQRRALPWVAVAAALALSLAAPARAAGAEPAAAPSSPDRLELVRLTPVPASQGGAEPGTMQLEAVLNYRLQSVSRGFLLLFTFENNAESSSQQSSQAIWVPAGQAQATLNIAYRPKPDVRSLTLVAGLFKDEQTMLAWVSTNPISLAPWPGREQFDLAMAARLGGNWAEADDHLSAAIDVSPDTSNYFFWRADTRVRLAQYDGAIADYTRALDLSPGDRPSRVGRGVALLWEGAWQQSIDDLTYAIDHSPTPDRWTAWAYRGRGLAHAGLNERSEAIADYRAYLSLVPDAPDTADVQAWIAALS